jgi:hypothetical protein
MGFQVETRGVEEVKQFIDKLPENSFDVAKDAFRESVTDAANKVKSFVNLKVRTGNLRRSIGQEVKGSTLKDLQASIYSAQGSGGSQVVYAPIQEFGGTVKAKDKYKWVKGGPYLNIPTINNLTAAGVMRMTAWEVFDQPGAHVRGKGVFIGDKIMFTLVKSVTLTERLGMRAAMEDQIPTLLSTIKEQLGEGI